MPGCLACSRDEPMQGYLTLAVGSQFYRDLSINLALSLKLNDPTRPVCVVLDRGAQLPVRTHRFVDDVVYLDPQPGYHGCLNKLRMGEVSPYAETMFIDSDCLLIKQDMDRHWAKHQSPGFMIGGDRVTTGHWYGFDIAQVIAKLKVNYIVRMNSGVFYFRKGQATTDFFACTQRLVDSHGDLLGVHHRNSLQLADEPFLGAAQGLLNIEPLDYDPVEGSIMVTTINASNVHFDAFTQSSDLTIHGDFCLLNRWLPRSKVHHSPSIAHFVKLKPPKQYRRNVIQLRQYFGLPPFDKA